MPLIHLSRAPHSARQPFNQGGVLKQLVVYARKFLTEMSRIQYRNCLHCFETPLPETAGQAGRDPRKSTATTYVVSTEIRPGRYRCTRSDLPAAHGKDPHRPHTPSWSRRRSSKAASPQFPPVRHICDLVHNECTS